VWWKCDLLLEWYSVNYFWTFIIVHDTLRMWKMQPLLARRFPCKFCSLQIPMLTDSIFLSNSIPWNFLSLHVQLYRFRWIFRSLQIPFLAKWGGPTSDNGQCCAICEIIIGLNWVFTLRSQFTTNIQIKLKGAHKLGISTVLWCWNLYWRNTYAESFCRY